jgi:hypothetical protein
MSTSIVMLTCFATFCLGILLIVGGFFLYFYSTGMTMVLHKRLAQGLAVLCMLGSAGFLEYSTYVMTANLY